MLVFKYSFTVLLYITLADATPQNSQNYSSVYKVMNTWIDQWLVPRDAKYLIDHFVGGQKWGFYSEKKQRKPERKCCFLCFSSGWRRWWREEEEEEEGGCVLISSRSDDDDDDDVSQRAEGSGCSQPLRSRRTPHTERPRTRGDTVSPQTSHPHRHHRQQPGSRAPLSVWFHSMFTTVCVCVGGGSDSLPWCEDVTRPMTEENKAAGQLRAVRARACCGAVVCCVSWRQGAGQAAKTHHHHHHHHILGLTE